MSIIDPSLTLASELGNLSVQELGLRKVHEEIQKAKHDILDKDKLLVESFADKENLKRQVDVVRQALEDAKYLLWDNITKKINKVKISFGYTVRSKDIGNNLFIQCSFSSGKYG